MSAGLLAELVEFLKQDTAGRYLAVAALTIVVYDHLLTLDDEVEYVHRTRWSLTKFIFLANRYLLLLLFAVTSIANFWPAPPDAFCVESARFIVANTLCIGGLTGLSLAVRVYAFWDQHRGVRAVLAAAFTVSLGLSSLSVGMVYRNTRPIHLPLPTLFHGCLVGNKIDFWSFLMVMPLIVYDCMIVLLTVGRARALGHGTNTPLISHLYHTGIGYFLVMLGANVITLLILVRSELLGLLLVRANLSAGLASFMCSHMLLYLRENLTDRSSRRLNSMTFAMAAFSDFEFPVVPPWPSGLDQDPWS